MGDLQLHTGGSAAVYWGVCSYTLGALQLHTGGSAALLCQYMTYVCQSHELSGMFHQHACKRNRCTQAPIQSVAPVGVMPLLPGKAPLGRVKQAIEHFDYICKNAATAPFWEICCF